MDEILILYALCFFAVALLYASVGHGGASGYLALMALFGFAPMVMKPTALLLNLLVSFVAFLSFYKAQFFRPKLLWPLIFGSIPFSYLGAIIPLSDSWYKKMLALILLLSVFRLLMNQNNTSLKTEPKFWILLVIGSGIGLLSGMIGMGGGILLSPILILAGWANQKETAAISAVFIFLNSIAGLVGQYQKGFELAPGMLWIGITVLAGGWLGAS
ncbi:MAG: hypothetical protein B7X72_13610, partial [Sphingobacteriia bacterium 39-39-8]